MKRLLLLRHALPDSVKKGMTDKDRGLAPAGLYQAQKIGDFLKNNKYMPDFILCSDAVRTRQTFENMSLKTDMRVDYQSALYLPSADKILSAIHEVFDTSVETLLVITHYPGVLDFARNMAGNRPAFNRGYPEAALTIFECNIENWSDLSTSNCKPKRFIPFDPPQQNDKKHRL